jgi:Heterokaryon incompatibility protein (HET)
MSKICSLRASHTIVPDIDDMSSASLFQPLGDNEFRVLELWPSKSFSDPLKGSLRAAIRASATYDALSYVWLDEDLPQTDPYIHISDFSYPITPNVDAALRQCRDSNSPRKLWIDKICINQADEAEREVQIRTMEDIYSRASSVIVWLGPERNVDETKAAMCVLRFFTRSPLRKADPPWKYVASSTHQLIQAGLQDMFSRKWFQRIWVVQEAVLAQRVVMKCGTIEVDWTTDEPEYLRIVSRRIMLSEISPRWADAGLTRVDMQPILRLLQLQIRLQIDRHAQRNDRYALNFRPQIPRHRARAPQPADVFAGLDQCARRAQHA